ncbi:hypothetical protein LCI18_002298 [Fusarium solani-melongenae]|uniref:Uncharacterized protein n=1 Tax=Fusarium solani subsp. cucurbitae TaxID=2747967 RepID=A0ACD3YR76_FUSSC|nr:hypothetical protein LCI18_002298 [Fusarium solani-melongenae]
MEKPRVVLLAKKVARSSPEILDTPWNYNEDGSPKAADLAQQFADQEDYVAAVTREEDRNGEETHRLSETLRDLKRQQLATAMRLYKNGKIGSEPFEVVFRESARRQGCTRLFELPTDLIYVFWFGELVAVWILVARGEIL